MNKLHEYDVTPPEFEKLTKRGHHTEPGILFPIYDCIIYREIVEEHTDYTYNPPKHDVVYSGLVVIQIVISNNDNSTTFSTAFYGSIDDEEIQGVKE